MKRYEGDYWVRNHDMPHEELMDEGKIALNDLTESIRRDIQVYEELYKEAMSDGYIDEVEEKELITKSYKITQRIKKEHLGDSPSEEGGGALGILAGIGIAIGVMFGINKMQNQ